MSVRTEQAMIQRFGVKAERIVRFPFRVDDQFLRHEGTFSEEERTLIADRPYFLIPARFVGIKRIGMAIRSFAQIAARHPDVLLVLIGKGPLEETFRAQVAALGLGDRVLFRSWSQALYAWYHQALATLVVSDCEGYAMTTLESLVSGTPVVMTDVGCAPEVIREGENGYIIPVGNEEMLVQRLEDVLANRDRLKVGAGQFSYTEPANGMKELLEKAGKSYPQG
jgi:glycosyltransferase involved in cell wall biosynthesis